MRRVLKAVTQGRNAGDITTIEDEGSVEEAKHAWQQMREQLDAKLASVGPATASVK
jgi:acetyl-CoA synthetase